jgi:hypothetical protein
MRDDRPGWEAVKGCSAAIHEQDAPDSAIKPLTTALTCNAATRISTSAQQSL